MRRSILCAAGMLLVAATLAAAAPAQADQRVCADQAHAATGFQICLTTTNVENEDGSERHRAVVDIGHIPYPVGLGLYIEVVCTDEDGEAPANLQVSVVPEQSVPVACVALP